MKVKLTENQESLRKIIEENLKVAKNWENEDRESVRTAFANMSSAAHELHMSLEPRPKHHKYMIENRGMEPENPEFYNHIHPVEDLLSYLDNTSANDDPVDQTIGQDFKLGVYTSRWGHKDNYLLTRTKDGWNIEFDAYHGECEKDGSPVLNEILRHDSVSYPQDIGYYMYAIWDRAMSAGLSHEKVQSLLDELGDWISQTEQSAPKHILI